MTEVIKGHDDTPSDQIARLYEDFRTEIKSLLFAVLKSTSMVEDAQSPSVTDFEHRDYFILEFTLSVEDVEVKLHDRLLVVDILEIRIVFNIVDRKILTIKAKTNGIQWDVDEAVTIERFEATAKQIRTMLEKAMRKQSLDTEVLRSFQYSKIDHMAKTMMIYLTSAQKAVELIERQKSNLIEGDEK